MGDAEFSLTLKAFTIQAEEKQKQASKAQPYLFQMKFEMFFFFPWKRWT